MINLNNLGEYNDVVKSDKLILIDFYATWCAPCTKLFPLMLEMKSKFGEDIDIYKVDIDEVYELVEKFKIKHVPTVVFIKNKEELGRLCSLVTENNLVKKISDFK